MPECMIRPVSQSPERMVFGSEFKNLKYQNQTIHHTSNHAIARDKGIKKIVERAATCSISTLHLKPEK